MKLNLISKSMVVGSLTITSFYGFHYLQDSEEKPNIAETSNLKTSKSSATVKSKNKVLATIQPVTPITENFSLINEGEMDFSADTEDVDKNLSEVSFENGLLSITAKDAILAEVVAQVSNKAQIPIASEAIQLNRRVTLSVHNVSLNTGLRKLIEGYDFFFLFDGKNNQLKATWIYPAGTGETVALTHSDTQKELSEDDLFSSNPVSRILALQQHTGPGNKNAINQIKEALSDTDPNVRATAILSAQENIIALPIPTLKEMATSDTSPLVRSVALMTLSMTPDLPPTTMTELAENALNDPDESIREEAEAILNGLEENEDSETLQLQQPHPDANEYEEVSKTRIWTVQTVNMTV